MKKTMSFCLVIALSWVMTISSVAVEMSDSEAEGAEIIVENGIGMPGMEETKTVLAVDYNSLSISQQKSIERPDGVDLHVSMPEAVPFVIDPVEMDGRGQVYSECFEVLNYSDSDVYVDFNEIFYEFANDTDFISVERPFTIDEHHLFDGKAIYMAIHTNQSGALPISDTPSRYDKLIYLEASNYDDNGEWLSFNEGSRSYFYFSGNVSYTPENSWNDKDVVVSLRYSIEPVLTVGNEVRENEEEIVADESDSEYAVEEVQDEPDSEYAVEEVADESDSEYAVEEVQDESDSEYAVEEVPEEPDSGESAEQVNISSNETSEQGADYSSDLS